MNTRAADWAAESETEAVPDSLTPDGPTFPETFLVVRMKSKVLFRDLDGDGEWDIGRSADAGISVDDQQVSRRHAKLRLAQGVLSLEDLGSRNGTLINGRALHSGIVRIGAGDVV